MPDPIALPGAPLPMSTARRPHTEPQLSHEAQQLRRVAEDFESVFLSEMLAPMFEGISTDGLGGGGMGEEMFRPMLIERYAESIAKSGGIGIADSVVREFMRMQAAEATVISAATEEPDGAHR